MALVQSVELELGTRMPRFELKDPHGKTYISDAQYGEKGLWVVFTCNHCPYAKALWPRVIHLSDYARGKGILTVAINPNINPDYPDDSPEMMKGEIKKRNIPFPYLVDDSQDVARGFQAQCTPDIYLFNAEHRLVYHGRVDDNWQDESRVTQHELRQAIDNLAAGRPIAADQRPSMGCSIKWRSPQ